jgi:formylglycine-generating enzyme required for sulfatase activity
MLLAMKFEVAITVAALASPIALTTAVPALDPKVASEFAEIAAANFQYRLAGDFSENGKPAVAPQRDIRLGASLKIMRRQVTAAEYSSCADDGGCPRIPHAAGLDRPMVGVSWRDATAYAEWITRKSGILHRLPTDEEWVFATGETPGDEALPLLDPADPSQAWIARYEAEANRERPIVLDPQPVGTFGRNGHGLQDMTGNVWEWTDTCFIRGHTGRRLGPSHQHQLRRPCRRRRAPHLHDGLHPRSPQRRLCRRRAARQSRFPAGCRRRKMARLAPDGRARSVPDIRVELAGIFTLKEVAFRQAAMRLAGWHGAESVIGNLGATVRSRAGERKCPVSVSPKFHWLTATSLRFPWRTARRIRCSRVLSCRRCCGWRGRTCSRWAPAPAW